MKRYPLQIICNSEEEREQLKKALLLLKSSTGERTAKTIIKLGGNKNERNMNGSLDRKMYIHL